MKLVSAITTLLVGFLVYKVVETKRCRRRMEVMLDRLKDFEMEVTEAELVKSLSPTPPSTPVQESLLGESVGSFEKIE